MESVLPGGDPVTVPPRRERLKLKLIALALEIPLWSINALLVRCMYETMQHHMLEPHLFRDNLYMALLVVVVLPAALCLWSARLHGGRQVPKILGREGPRTSPYYKKNRAGGVCRRSV